MLRRRAVGLCQRAFQAQQGCRALEEAHAAARNVTAAASASPRQPAALRAAGQQLRQQHGGGGSGGGWYRDGRGYEHFQAPGTGVRGVLSHNSGRLLAVLGAGAVVVWWSSRQEIPYTHRKHAVLMSTAVEQALGEATFKQVLAEAQKNGTLVPAAHPEVARVARIGQQIADAASDGTGDGFSEHMKGLAWEYVVINSQQLNAFVVPGGKVVVFAKMLQLCRSDDELASVLAHETAHVLARHAAERVTEQSWIAVLQLLVYVALGLALPSDLFAFTLSLPHSRKQELEADQIGMLLAAKACFDPAAGMQVFTRLGEIEKQSPVAQIPKLLRTHPMSDARVRGIEDHLPEALQMAERAGCNVKQQRFFDIFSVLEPATAASQHSQPDLAR